MFKILLFELILPPNIRSAFIDFRKPFDTILFEVSQKLTSGLKSNTKINYRCTKVSEDEK